MAKTNQKLTIVKRSFCLLTCFFILLNLYSQTSNEQDINRDYFLEKSKRLNKTGWILLGVGTPLAAGGMAAMNKNFGDEGSAADFYALLMVAGFAMDIASIPVFISAGKNKRRAATFTLDYQNLYPPENWLVARRNQPIPSVTLRIHF